MAIPSSGTIKMGGAGTNSIAQVKAGTDTGTPTAVTNVSLRGLSVDGVTDFNDGTNRDITVAGSSPDQTAPHAMSEFHGYTQIAMGSFPNLGQGYANDAGMTGSLSSTGFGFEKTHVNTAFAQQAGAFAVIGARHTASNGYVTLQFYSGTNATAATVYYQKLTYTGLSGATWSMKYEYPNTSNAIQAYERYGISETTYDEAKHPATSGGGSYNEGTYYAIPTSGGFRQFPWVCTAEYRGDPLNDNAQARLGFSSDQVQITLKATLNGTDYTAASSTFTIDLNAQRLAGFIP